MSYALLSEVWGPDEVAPEQEEKPQVKKEEPKPEPVTETKETFAPAPISMSTHTPTPPKFIQDKKDSLPLFLSILVVGSCAIYAIDMFASKLSN